MNGKIENNLIGTSSRVETPFIKVTLAGVSLGVYTQSDLVAKQMSNSPAYTENYVSIQYPNFCKSLTITRNASGGVNTYKLNLTYAVRPDDDPNLIEKLLSKTKSQGRKIYFSYGDISAPNFIYKEEEALILTAKPTMSATSHVINYSITAVSTVFSQSATKRSFPYHKNAKPSTLIKQLLFNTEMGLDKLFYGMSTLEKVERLGLIDSDDVAVEIEAKKDISPLNYLIYLVSCMRWVNDSKRDAVKTSIYKIAIFDDIRTEIGGPYFKVRRYNSAEEVQDTDDLTYINVDIGYAQNSSVIDFKVNEVDAFSILYDYKDDISKNQYVYQIDEQGKIVSSKMPSPLKNGELEKLTESQLTWWTQVTQFPITATLTIRGLLRNALLMTKLKVNVLFYGKKHIYSGIYIINGQTDEISGSGYRTTLSLIRVGGVNYNG